MASRAFAIRDSYRDWLNDKDRAWPLTGWTAESVLVPRADLADKLLVEVVKLAPRTTRLETRGQLISQFTIGLSVRRGYPQGGAIDPDWVEELNELVEGIVNETADLTLDGQPAGYTVWVDNILDETGDLDLLDGERVFQSELVITFNQTFTR